MQARTRLVGSALAVALLVGGSGVVHGEENERGKQLFDLCVQCHGADGGGDPLALAPSIAGLEQWYMLAQLEKFRTGVRGTHFDDIPGMRMRPMSLTLRSEEDVAAVAAYVSSLPRVEVESTLEGDAARGQTLYAPCATCHGAKGEGNQTMSAPSLRHTSDWYLVSTMQRFKSGVRGSNPQDPMGALMRSFSQTLPDDQAIQDVIAYINTLSE